MGTYTALSGENAGTADLDVPSLLRLPSGFRPVGMTAAELAPGQSSTITLELLAEFPGSYSGTAWISTNDPLNPTFTFNVSGVVDAPAAQVTVGGSTVVTSDVAAGGAGGTPAPQIDFGDATLGAALTDTFTVTNSGTAAFVLSDPIVVPYGFNLVSDFGATTLAPGESTTFAVALDTSTAGDYRGTVAFQTNDPDQRDE